MEEIHSVTRIDRFFLHKIQRLAGFELGLTGGLPPENYAEGKRRSGESGASSFDTDEFFELALKRSYEQLGGSDTGDPGQ